MIPRPAPPTKRGLSLAFALVLAANANVFGQNAGTTVAATEIKSLPATISAPGHYILKRNLTTTYPAAAITINARDVTIDLGGKVLAYGFPPSGATAAIGIQLNNAAAGTNATSITVRNGTIKGFNTAVFLEDTASSNATLLVEDVVAVENGTGGIIALGDFVEVRNCRVKNTGFKAHTATTYGIFAKGRSTLVTGNTVEEISKGSPYLAYGIELQPSSSGVARDNTLTTSSTGAAQPAFGIHFTLNPATASGFAVDNKINNFTVGLGFDGSGSGKYRRNLTRNCTTAFNNGTAVGSENN